MTASRTLRTYYWLAKPGIIYGNAITAAGGFFLVAAGSVDWPRFAAMLLGISFIMGSACVLNNIIDRNIDRAMERTHKRALVSGSVSVPAALVYAGVLGVLGSLLLGFGTNLLTLGIALFGVFTYVVAYGWAKRRTIHSTLVGSVPGAVPPVVGYCAVSGQFDLGALLLFLVLVAWQMPHFYAIGIFRRSDYASANLPVLPVLRPFAVVRRHIIVYILAFIFVTALFTYFDYTGVMYLASVLVLGFYWLGFAVRPPEDGREHAWARKLFRVSLIVLTAFSVLISVDSLLP